MEERTCVAPGCAKPWKYKGLRLCGTHYARIRNNGTLEVQPPRWYPRPKKHPDVCTVDGCDRASHLRGWCVVHYRRWLATGEPGDAHIKSLMSNKGATCSVSDCEREAHSVGMCSVHYRRQYLKGDPGGEIGPRSPLLDDITYSGMHERMRRTLGPASLQSCADCGLVAEHWSYSNACLDERTDKGRRYCLHFDCYTPRCIPCHKRFDLKGGWHVDHHDRASGH